MSRVVSFKWKTDLVEARIIEKAKDKVAFTGDPLTGARYLDNINKVIGRIECNYAQFAERKDIIGNIARIAMVTDPGPGHKELIPFVLNGSDTMAIGLGVFHSLPDVFPTS